VPAILTYHHRNLEVPENLWKKTAVLTNYHRKSAVPASLWRELADLTYHHSKPAVAAKQWTGRDLKLVASKVGRLRLWKGSLSGSSEGSPKLGRYNVIPGTYSKHDVR
jgi:hypothetical protein